MMRKTPLVLLAALLPLAAVADPAADPSATFTTELRITVGADGRVGDVVLDRSLPAPVEQAVRTHVAGWRFEAPVRDGQRLGGTTYAHLTGCAVPSPAGLAISFGPASTGPGHGGKGIVGTHVMTGLPVKDDTRFTINAEYRVQPDGSVVVESVRSEGRRSRAMREFEQGVGKWLATRRFMPEEIGGVPVATRMTLPLHYDFRPARRGPLPKRPADAACQAALDATKTPDRPVAIDSPFRLAPAG